MGALVSPVAHDFTPMLPDDPGIPQPNTVNALLTLKVVILMYLDHMKK